MASTGLRLAFNNYIILPLILEISLKGKVISLRSVLSYFLSHLKIEILFCASLQPFCAEMMICRLSFGFKN